MMQYPDEDVKPIWKEMSDEEKEWYGKFILVMRYFDRKALRWLCMRPPGADYDKALIWFKEMDADRKRRAPSTRSERLPYYSPEDYFWSQPEPPAVKEQVLFQEEGDYRPFRKTYHRMWKGG